MSLNSSTTSAGDDATAAQYNDLREDVVQLAGDYAATTGSLNAYLVTLDAQVTAYTESLTIVVKANHSNTGASTINVNSLGAKSIVKHGSVALQTGDIRSGSILILKYDGTNFQLLAAPDNLYTAKGDLLVGTANGQKSPLTVGSDGQIPVASAAAATGLTYIEGMRCLSLDTSNVTIATSTAETTLFTFTVPANVMRTKNVVKGKIFLSILNQRSSTDCDFRLKFGSSTILTLQHDCNNTHISRGVVIDFTIANDSATNSQVAVMSLTAGASEGGMEAIAVLAADGTASEDTTTSKTLTVTAQFDDSNSATNLTKLHAEAFLIHRD